MEIYKKNSKNSRQNFMTSMINKVRVLSNISIKILCNKSIIIIIKSFMKSTPNFIAH